MGFSPAISGHEATWVCALQLHGFGTGACTPRLIGVKDISDRLLIYWGKHPGCAANVNQMEPHGLVILLLEDQENDVILVRRAAAKVDPNHQLRPVGNG